MAALFVAAALLATRALASHEANIAYRSPSLSIPELAVEIAPIIKRDAQHYGVYSGLVNFTHGVASGDPYPHSVILWTRPYPLNDTQSNLPICVRYEVSPSKDFEKICSSEQIYTTTEVDYSVKAEAEGLEAWSKYYYRFVNCANDANISPIGQFKTLPEADDNKIDKVSFAVYSCSNLPWGFFNAYGNVAHKESVDYIVHTGDCEFSDIYEARGDGEKGSYGNGTSLGRVPRPNHEIYTLDDYRQRYATYREDPDLQEAHRKFAWQLIWDDHEVADNSWKAGTADSNDTIAGTHDGVTFTERKANAVRAYFEWVPIRQVDTNDHLRIWRKFHFGTLADLIMLDTRNYDRDITDVYWNTNEVKALSGNANRSIMGARQEAWFYDTLVASQKVADWRVVGNQVLFSRVNYTQPTFQLNYDAWDGYDGNRERVLKTLAKNNVTNVIMLAGDSHANWVSDLVSPDALFDGSYDPISGKGAVGVEFGGTAVSSPSSYGQTLTPSAYTAAAQHLVDSNKELQWAEGATRGYFELHLTRQNATALFYGLETTKHRTTNETLLATFVVDKNANRLSRPIAGGKILGGAVQTRSK